ncbi:MAG: nuclear transport factor 2 family protein [Candidatus Limnocylindria bacterium]
MSELEDFVRSITARHVEADTALHNGDVALRKAMWSSNEPVTLFGAMKNITELAELGPAFDWLASQFSNCSQFEFEIVAAGVSGDLAYTVAYEHTTAAFGKEPARSYTLRVTHAYRREDGEWKVVHRHADVLADVGGSPPGGSGRP